MALKLTIKPKTTTCLTPVTQDVAVKAASEFRSLYLEADDVDARLQIARGALLDIVTERRDTNLVKGVAEKTVKIPTADGNRVLVLYAEKYKVLSDENIEPLREAFGEKYALFCEETTTVSLKKDTTLSDIEKAIGPKAWGAMQALLTVSKGVSPRDGAFTNIASLYKDDKTEMAKDLTALVDACIYSPTVRAK